MRANEFIVKEGPGDWMQGQVIKRKQTDQAKAQKANIPKIAKQVQEILASKVAGFLKTNTSNQGQTSDNLAEIVTQVLKKTLKVNVENDAFNNGLDLIKSQVEANPTNIATNSSITSGIADILSTSFSSDAEEAQDDYGISQRQVYDLPKEVADEDMLYAEHNGKWTLWRKSGRNRLVFINEIDPEEVPAVKELINATKTKSALLSFKQQQGDYYQTSTSVPK